MFRPIQIGLAFLVVLVSGAAQGLWSGRWVPSPALEAAAARLQQVPDQVGAWELHSEGEVGAKEQQIAGIVGWKSRTYVNRQTGQQVAVLLACGKPGAVAVHTPDVCFEGIGFRARGARGREFVTVRGGARPAEFWKSRFTRPEAGVPVHLLAYWGWNGGDGWVAADSPRLDFLGRAVLFKLHVSRIVTDEEGDGEPCLDFLRQFLPAVQDVLFAAEGP